MNKNFNMLFADIKKDLTAYVTLKLKILKLDIYEKSSVFSSLLLYSLIVLLVVFFAFLFLFLALGFYLGQLFNSFGTGMVLVAVLYIITLAMLLWQRKKIQNWLINLFVKQITQDEDDECEGE